MNNNPFYENFIMGLKVGDQIGFTTREHGEKVYSEVTITDITFVPNSNSTKIISLSNGCSISSNIHGLLPRIILSPIGMPFDEYFNPMIMFR